MTQTFSSGKRIFSVDMMHVYINIFKPSAVTIPIEHLEYVLDQKNWGESPGLAQTKRHSARDVLASPKSYKSDVERIKNANLKYPIILWRLKNGHYVVDGIHRITKAYTLGRKNINAYVFDTSTMNRFIIDTTGNWERVNTIPTSQIITTFYKRFLPPVSSTLTTTSNTNSAKK